MHIGWSVLLLWYFRYVATLEENDPCKISTGADGICVNIHRCPYAKYLLQRNEYPITCGFQGKIPIVCCTEMNAQIFQNSKFIRIRKPGDVSTMQCKEHYPHKEFAAVVPGAVPSLVKEFPHMAIIGFGEKSNIQWQCGGSLISRHFILTAAHCLISRELGSATWVRLGDLDLATDTDDASPQDYAIKRGIPHPFYKRPSRYHDIGLIELNQEVNITEYVKIACLDTKRQHLERQMVATGWGKAAFNGDFSSFLLKINLDIISADRCTPFYKKSDQISLPNGLVDDWQICAGGGKEQDTCQGDSGGPLQIINGDLSASIKVYNIIGVTSFGKACGLSDAPGIYTRVFNYLSWIEDIVWPTS